MTKIILGLDIKKVGAILQVSRFGLEINPDVFAFVRAQANRYCNSVRLPECMTEAKSWEIFILAITASSISSFESGLPAADSTCSKGDIKS